MLNKPNLVFLPGYDGDGKHSFARLATLLPDYAITIVDFPYADFPNRKYSLDDLATFTKVYVEKHVKGKFHLIGLSLGGVVAIRYAEDYPEQLLSLTLLNSTTTPVIRGGIMVWFKIARVFLRNQELARKLASLYGSPTLRRILAKLPIPPLNGQISPKTGYAIFGTLLNVIDDVLTEKYRLKLSELKTKRRAILFRDDKIFPAGRHESELVRYGFEVTVRERGGHGVTDDYWEQIAQYVKQNINYL